jgi:hypothetical protein
VEFPGATVLIANPAFSAIGTERDIVTGQTINAASTHTYIVKVRVSIDTAQFSGAIADCVLAGAEAATGLFNAARVLHLGVQIDGTACVTPPNITHTKVVTTNPPTSTGVGTYSVVYQIDVTNSASVAGSYTLDEMPRFGAGVSITSSTVTGPAGFTTLNNALTNGSSTNLVTNRPLAANTTDSYTVTLNVSINFGTFNGNAADCVLQLGETLTGLRNDATLTFDGSVTTKDACTTTSSPDITHTKALGATPVSAVSGSPGEYFVNYRVVVTNNSAAAPGIYSLSDMPRFNAGVTILSATVALNGGAATAATFTNGSSTTLATNSSLAASGVDTYDIQMRVRIDFAVFTANGADCVFQAGETRTGLWNDAVLTVAGVNTTASACTTTPPPSFSVTKTITSGPTAVSGTPNRFTLSYTLTVNNTSAIDGVYSLDDRPLFGAGVSIVSSTVSNGFPAAVPANSLVNNSSTVIATNRGLVGNTALGYAPHSYVVTLTVDVDFSAGQFSGAAASCATTGNDTLKALNNRTRLSYAASTQDAYACDTVVPPAVTHVKNFGSYSEVAGQPGVYDVTYSIVVSNTSATTGVYNLTDTARFGAGVSIQSASVSGQVTINPATFVINTPTTLNTGAVINGSSTHTYNLSFRVAIDFNSFNGAAADCVIAGAADRTGLYNEAALTFQGVVTVRQACDTPPPPTITVSKTLTTGPTSVANNPGQYTLSYTVTVINTSSVGGTYNLTDTPLFGAGVSIVSSSVTGTAAPLGANPFVNGSATTLATNRPLAGNSSHSYVASFTVQVDFLTFTGLIANCTLDAGESTTGLLNRAILTYNGTPITREACTTPPPPVITHVKTLVGLATPVVGQPGQYDVNYQIVVTNSTGNTGAYSLSDTPRFGAGVSILSSSVSGATTIATPAFSLGSATTLATNKVLNANSNDTYNITYRVSVNFGTFTGLVANCTLDGVETGTGLYNEATLRFLGVDTVRNACTLPTPPTITHAKSLIGAATLVVGQANTYDVNFRIVVTNGSASAGQYTLTDTPRFGAGVSIVSSSVSGATTIATPAFSLGAATTLASNRTLNASSTDTYDITYRVTVNFASFTGAAADCTMAVGESNTGLFNDSALTFNGNTTYSNACTTVSMPGVSVLKEVLGAPTDLGNDEFSVSYRIVVTNQSSSAATYDLKDTPLFGTGVSILQSSVSGEITLNNPAFLGVGSTTTLASNRPLAGNAVHTYVVTFRVKVDRVQFSGAVALCSSIPSLPRAALHNQAVLTFNGVDTPSAACTTPPGPPLGIPVNQPWMLVLLLLLLAVQARGSLARRRVREC